MEFGPAGTGMVTLGVIDPLCEAGTCTWTAPASVVAELDTEYDWRMTLIAEDHCSNSVMYVGPKWRFRVMADCNGNGMSDTWDIATVASDDNNNNLVPDECEDCNDRIVFTTSAEFQDEGQASLVNVNLDSPDQLGLNLSGVRPFPFIWVAASKRGTVVKIDTETGEILGEYRTAPENYNGSSLYAPDPSRTTVDLFGAVWAANRNEGSDGMGSVVKIALAEAHDCVDRNGNSQIDTSQGLGDVRGWPGSEATDALDECIVTFVRLESSGTRSLAVDDSNDLWVGGRDNHKHFKLDGTTGDLLASLEPQPSRGGYGALLDQNGVLWSTSSSHGGPTISVDTTTAPYPTTVHDSLPHFYGLGMDPTTGDVWATFNGNNLAYKILTESTAAPFDHGGSTAQGIAVDSNQNVWVAHSKLNSSVGHLRTDGSYVGVINLPDCPNLSGCPGLPECECGPTGVAVDANGKVWVTNFYDDSVYRIDPQLGALGQSPNDSIPIGDVDLQVSLNCDSVYCIDSPDDWCCQNGPHCGNDCAAEPDHPCCEDAEPYNYSDMTGVVSLAAAEQGHWTTVIDRKVAGTEWTEVHWNTESCVAEPEPPGSSIVVEVRAADNESAMGSLAFVSVANGAAISNVVGRYLQIRAILDSENGIDAPVLCDLELRHAALPVSTSVGQLSTLVVLDVATHTDLGTSEFRGALFQTDEPFHAAAYALAHEANGDGNVTAFQAVFDELVEHLDWRGFVGTLDVRVNSTNVGIAFYGVGPADCSAIENIGIPDGTRAVTCDKCEAASGSVNQQIDTDVPFPLLFGDSRNFLGVLADSCDSDADCHDSFPCTVDTCSGSTCQNEPVACDDGLLCTNDACNPAIGGCENEPIDCDDNDLCTADQCTEGVGCDHPPIDCDDGDLCTDDFCDPGSGCYYDTHVCETGNFCDGVWDCDPGTGCHATGDPCIATELLCDEGLDRCVECIDAQTCDDGDPTNGPEICLAGICESDTSCSSQLWDEDGNCVFGTLVLTAPDGGNAMTVSAGETLDLVLVKFTNQLGEPLGLHGITAYAQATTVVGDSTALFASPCFDWGVDPPWEDVLENSFYGTQPDGHPDLAVDDPTSLLIIGALRRFSGTSTPPPALTVAEGETVDLATINLTAPTIAGTYEFRVVHDAFRRIDASDGAGKLVGVITPATGPSGVLTVEVQ